MGGAAQLMGGSHGGTGGGAASPAAHGDPAAPALPSGGGGRVRIQAGALGGFTGAVSAAGSAGSKPDAARSVQGPQASAAAPFTRADACRVSNAPVAMLHEGSAAGTESPNY